MQDPLRREDWDYERWECLIRAVKEGRLLTKDEVDCLQEHEVRAAWAHGLVDRDVAERRLIDIADEAWWLSSRGD
jgi:hypothetical protein